VLAALTLSVEAQQGALAVPRRVAEGPAVHHHPLGNRRLAGSLGAGETVVPLALVVALRLLQISRPQS
tara:strand:+ start:4429 stop:4632 length:204 start_codon:yes stop_codon:yes gene_type:complete